MNPVIQHTIGLVTSTAVERTPVIAELVALLESERKGEQVDARQR